MKIFRICALVGLIAALALIAGCSGGQKGTATTDPKTVYTQVAQQAAETAAAQLTTVAKLTPKATSTPEPTETPTQSSTSGTPNPTTSGTQAATNATPGGNLPTTVILPTDTKQAVAVPDKLLYISQTVADGTVIKPSTGFSLTWKIQNVGTTTWDGSYRVRLYGGERFGVQDFALKDTVKPEDTISITVDMTTPSATGAYNSIWVLTNPDGVNFGYFTFNCEVK